MLITLSVFQNINLNQSQRLFTTLVYQFDELQETVYKFVGQKSPIFSFFLNSKRKEQFYLLISLTRQTFLSQKNKYVWADNIYTTYFQGNQNLQFNSHLKSNSKFNNHIHQMNSLTIQLLTLLLITPTLTHQHSNSNNNHHLPTLTIIEPSTQFSKRLLTSSTPPLTHPFIIYPHVPLSTFNNLDISSLRVCFSVAVMYYRNVIRVSDIKGEKPTHYPRTASQICGIEVPEKYFEEGFDQKYTDLVVFIAIQQDVARKYIASSSSCVFNTRPTYGFVRINAVNFSPDTLQPRKFHHHIMILIHELTHILAFGVSLFSEFRGGVRNFTKQPFDEVMKSLGGRSMISTPSVKKFAQDFFGCDREGFGALLEDEGGHGSVDSHWAKQVFGDELMTSAPSVTSARMTPFTLLLIQDSNFYDEVDSSMSEPPKIGYMRGCAFALGQLQFKKDHESGFCLRKTQEDSDEKPCNSSQGLQYRYDNRCFQLVNPDTSSNNSTLCVPMRCYNFSIYIFDNGDERACHKGQNTVTVGDQEILCPENIQEFCHMDKCPGWCNSRGLCLKNKCICQPPYFGEACLDSCQFYYDTTQGICVDKCPPQTYLDGIGRLCVKICPSGFVNSLDGRCIVCDSACEDSALQIRSLSLASSIPTASVLLAIILLILS